MSKTVYCLLVDDDPDDQELFKYAVQKVGTPVELTVADDGVHALELLNNEQFSPDIIFMDLNMPRLNGLECISEIKKMERLSAVPLYIFSTAHEYQNNIDIKRLGVDRYVEKPSNVLDLVPMLSEIFRKLD